MCDTKKTKSERNQEQPAVGATVDLRQGLSTAEVHRRLEQGLRLNEAGYRVLAFYLTEMEDRRLYNDTAHASTAHYAEARHNLDRRRTGELISVGRKLLDLPAIDAAFCAGRLSWSKLLLLMRVVAPEHEDAWLERALDKTCTDLKQDVKLARPGRPPRKDGDISGLPHTRYRVSAQVDPVTHQKMENALRKLSDERDTAVDTAELLDVAAELILGTEEDGTLPGRKRVNGSIYKLVVRADDQDDDGPMVLDTDDGAVPIDPMKLDVATPPGLRRHVLRRDGAKCRCCGSRYRLQVHHIQFRSEGGPTKAWNLITLCAGCHGRVHDGLLVLEGERQDRIRFVSRHGEAVNGTRKDATPVSLLVPPELREPSPPPVTLDTVPGEIDGAWWRRHAHLLRYTRERGLTLREGHPEPQAETDEVATSAPQPEGKPFDGIVGQDALLRRLTATARGRRARGGCFPHTLLYGPAGTGKTTLAKGIACAFGTRLHAASGPLLSTVSELVPLLAELSEGDMLFIDEVHAVPTAVLEALYEALADRQMSISLSTGSRTRTVRLQLPAFTLLAATTEQGDLTDALVSRFGLRECLAHYDEADLAALAAEQARVEGFVFTHGASMELARHARGTPRETLRLLECVLDHVAARGKRRASRSAVAHVLETLGYDADGLDPVEQRYMEVVRTSRSPVSLERIARILGMGVRAVARNLEPYLFRRGLIRMTPRGRTANHAPRLLTAHT